MEYPMSLYSIDGVSYEFMLASKRQPHPLPAFIAASAGTTRERVGAANLAVLDTQQAVARASRLLDDYCERSYVAVAGQGGYAFTCGVAAEIISLGLSPDATLEVMQLHWNECCVPPWDAHELKDKIWNASQYAQNEAGAYYVPPVQERISAEALDKLIADSVSVTAPVAEASEERSRFNWMDEDQFSSLPAPVWLLKDKLMRNSIAMLYGPSGHYKSFIGLLLAGEVAVTGECAFYVAAEGIERMAAKDFPAWKLAYGVDHKLPLYMTDEMPKAFQGEAEFTAFAKSIRAKAAGRKVGIIFLNTLNRS